MALSLEVAERSTHFSGSTSSIFRFRYFRCKTTAPRLPRGLQVILAQKHVDNVVDKHKMRTILNAIADNEVKERVLALCQDVVDRIRDQPPPISDEQV
jgi:hypothetical protein